MGRLPLQDRTADEIQQALSQAGDDLTLEQAAEILDFIRRVGGVANARLAVDVLQQIERAA